MDTTNSTEFRAAKWNPTTRAEIMAVLSTPPQLRVVVSADDLADVEEITNQ